MYVEHATLSIRGIRMLALQSKVRPFPPFLSSISEHDSVRQSKDLLIGRQDQQVSFTIQCSHGLHCSLQSSDGNRLKRLL
jgi:hypothetical protein